MENQKIPGQKNSERIGKYNSELEKAEFYNSSEYQQFVELQERAFADEHSLQIKRFLKILWIDKWYIF